MQLRRRDRAIATPVGVNEEIVVLCHGGPLAEPDDAHVLGRTRIVGFFGASSMERLPTEVAMTENMGRWSLTV